MTRESAEAEALLDHLFDLAKYCMLPELKEDLDSSELQASHFQTYHDLLMQELPKLYDLVQKFIDISVLNYDDSRHEKLRGQLVVLLCEMTATPTVFQLKDGAQSLIRNAHELLSKLIPDRRNTVDAHVFTYYEQNLHKNTWKRQIGAVHGFVQYLKLRYAGEFKMSPQMLPFCLAVGLNVRECYDPIYKQLGSHIFFLMLKQSNCKDIQKLNVHSVIYDNVFKDAYGANESVEATAATWTCLYLCLDHFTEMDHFTWNQCDDMLERLIQNVTMSSNVANSVCLVQFITKLCYYFSINRSEIEVTLANDLTPQNLTSCKEICASLNACISYRWAKRILQMLVLESDKLLQSVDACIQLMSEMMRCYLVCILPIPLEALNYHLPEFYTKFVAILLESLVVLEKDKSVAQLVLQFIEIFRFQLDNSRQQKLPFELQEYPNALKSLELMIVK